MSRRRKQQRRPQRSKRMRLTNERVYRYVMNDWSEVVR